MFKNDMYTCIYLGIMHVSLICSSYYLFVKKFINVYYTQNFSYVFLYEFD